MIEVLVAVTLLAVISFLIWQAMGVSTLSKERFEKKDSLYRAATLSMDRMSRDLQMAVLFTNIELLGVSVSGEQMTKSVFIGANNGDQDKISVSSRRRP
ncbi:MAG: hypothetical protein HY073_00635 [Deltaproteobacteria bacterium]|nr:hypothetical protein [Deltaproteobacteria bacterium]